MTSRQKVVGAIVGALCALGAGVHHGGIAEAAASARVTPDRVLRGETTSVVGSCSDDGETPYYVVIQAYSVDVPTYPYLWASSVTLSGGSRFTGTLTMPADAPGGDWMATGYCVFAGEHAEYFRAPFEVNTWVIMPPTGF